MVLIWGSFHLTYFCINVDSSLVDKQIQLILFMDYDLQFVYTFELVRPFCRSFTGLHKRQVIKRLHFDCIQQLISKVSFRVTHCFLVMKFVSLWVQTSITFSRSSFIDLEWDPVKWNRCKEVKTRLSFLLKSKTHEHDPFSHQRMNIICVSEQCA